MQCDIASIYGSHIVVFSFALYIVRKLLSVSSAILSAFLQEVQFSYHALFFVNLCLILVFFSKVHALILFSRSLLLLPLSVDSIATLTPPLFPGC